MTDYLGVPKTVSEAEQAGSNGMEELERVDAPKLRWPLCRPGSTSAPTEDGLSYARPYLRRATRHRPIPCAAVRGDVHVSGLVTVCLLIEDRVDLGDMIVAAASSWIESNTWSDSHADRNLGILTGTQMLDGIH